MSKKSNVALSKNSNRSETNKKTVNQYSEKKKLFEELRNIRNKEETFKPSNHNDFMPK